MTLYRCPACDPGDDCDWCHGRRKVTEAKLREWHEEPETEHGQLRRRAWKGRQEPLVIDTSDPRVQDIATAMADGTLGNDEALAALRELAAAIPPQSMGTTDLPVDFERLADIMKPAGVARDAWRWPSGLISGPRDNRGKTHGPQRRRSWKARHKGGKS